ncbi:hypothetical protein F5Y16DRAFT_262051 [Xylariaceae sp. FL0255]|nr:hypothetical protein F5Y16DRAFT_262051 [Xylariaceae sp. FL0255]
MHLRRPPHRPLARSVAAKWRPATNAVHLQPHNTFTTTSHRRLRITKLKVGRIETSVETKSDPLKNTKYLRFREAQEASIRRSRGVTPAYSRFRESQKALSGRPSNPRAERNKAQEAASQNGDTRPTWLDWLKAREKGEQRVKAQEEAQQRVNMRALRDELSRPEGFLAPAPLPSPASLPTTTHDPDQPPLQEQEQEQNRDQEEEPQAKKPSLFQKLFPWETETSTGPDGNDRVSFTNAWVEQLFPGQQSEPPRVDLAEFGDESLLREVEQDLNEDEKEEDIDHYIPEKDRKQRHARAILVLEAASKNLVESDFLRLGMQGKHIEGWVGGILKVIQSRNPDTLEANGKYYILFDSKVAAETYRDNINRHWGAAKSYVPGAHHKTKLFDQPFLPFGLRSNESGIPGTAATAGVAAEDIESMIRRFTLIAPDMRQSVFLLTRKRHPIVRSLDQTGGLVNRLANRLGSPHLVLVRVEGGRITRGLLKSAIREDERQRNLHWRIADLHNGIVPFGRSRLREADVPWRMLKAAGREWTRDDVEFMLESAVDIYGLKKDKALEESDIEDRHSIQGEGNLHNDENEDFLTEEEQEREQQRQDSLIEQEQQEENDSQFGNNTIADPQQTQEEEEEEKENRQTTQLLRKVSDQAVWYPRFIIPFRDSVEAHRFVRCWHRRELMWKKWKTKSLFAAPKEEDRPEGQEQRVLNVSLLW